jgi:Domain of unknown function (DUF1330)
MPKGYWIPHIDVSDPEGYKAYVAATPAAHEKYGGRALVRGGARPHCCGSRMPRECESGLVTFLRGCASLYRQSTPEKPPCPTCG